MKYVVYYRVSTKKQGESGLGLDAQRVYIENFYPRKDVVAEFEDVISGKDINNRPELRKAIELCKSNGYTLVVAKIDRLSRKTEHALAIYEELNGRLQSCDIPNLDKFTLTLFMAIADRERELIALRTKNALEVKRNRDEEWRKGSEPFKNGAATEKAVKVTKQKAKDNINNRLATAHIVQLAKSSKDWNWNTIAKELNQKGFKTSQGKQFQAVQVKRLYDNQSQIVNS